MVELHNPADMPEPQKVERIEEPWIEATILVPDEHLGYLALDWVTMGQVLSFPMIVVGILLIVLAYRRQSVQEAEA